MLLIRSLVLLIVFFSLAAYGQECGDTVLDANEQCDDGNFFGGDGCAANCTPETLRTFTIDPERSFAATQLINFSIEFSLNGEIRLTGGQPSTDGFIPFVLREGAVSIDQVSVPGLVCACTVVLENAATYGPGNAGFGGIECGTGPPAPDRLFRVPETVVLTRDHKTNDVDPLCEMGVMEGEEDLHTGSCNGPLILQPEGRGGRGSAVVVNNLTLRLIRDGGACSIDPTDPRKGADGIPCSADDPVGPGDPAQTVRIDPAGAFTGQIIGAVLDANNITNANISGDKNCGTVPCRVMAEGEKVDCDALMVSPTTPIATGVLALAFPILDAEGIGDSVVTVKLVPKAGVAVSCPADCNGDHEVTVNELVLGVNIALGSAAVTQCPAFDTNSDNEVAINELVAGVRVALEGCP